MVSGKIMSKLKYLPWRVEGLDIHSSFSTTEHIGNGVYKIRFDDGWETTACSAQLRSGVMKSPLHKKVYGVGCIGFGKYNSISHKKPYQTWKAMFDRCYWKDYVEYHLYGGRGVEVCDEWHNFQNFAEWYVNRYKDGYVLDKDLRGSGKIYCPDSCTLIPPAVNAFITNSIGRLGENIYTGVYLSGERYKVHCCQLNKIPKYLGMYSTAEEAYDVYEKEKIRLAKVLAIKVKSKVDDEVFTYLMNFEKYVRDLTENPYNKKEKLNAN